MSCWPAAMSANLSACAFPYQACLGHPFAAAPSQLRWPLMWETCTSSAVPRSCSACSIFFHRSPLAPASAGCSNLRPVQPLKAISLSVQ
eukprot:435804-Pyramimonas_sp.AAC.1